MDTLTTTIQQDPCKVSSSSGAGLCDVLPGVTVQASAVVRAVFRSVDFTATFLSHIPDRLQIRARHIADGNLTTVMLPRVANGSVGSTSYLRCSTAVQEGTHLITCATSLGAEELLLVTVSADSLATGDVLSEQFEVPGSGEHTHVTAPSTTWTVTWDWA